MAVMLGAFLEFPGAQFIPGLAASKPADVHREDMWATANRESSRSFPAASPVLTPDHI